MRFKRLVLLCISLFFNSVLIAQQAASAEETGNQEEIWLIHQDFYSIGKRDVYEALRKVWLQQLVQLSSTRTIPPILTLQAKGDPEYIALIPLGNFAALDGFYAIGNALKNQVAAEVWKKQHEALSSTLNFQINSLHKYLPECSCLPSEMNVSVMNLPYVHYFVYSIEPGQGSQFEAFLQRKVNEHINRKTAICWRVWKVLFGGDIPKYVLVAFSGSEESLVGDVKKMDVIDPAIEKIVRRENEGKAILRRDLSFVPENQ